MTTIDRLAKAYPRASVSESEGKIRLQMGNAVLSLTARQWQVILRQIDGVVRGR